MNLFEEITQREIPCELCGSPTIAMYRYDWDNDRFYCTNLDCGAEYIVPTTTEITQESKS